MGRANEATNEFTDNDKIIYGAFWHRFMFRRGLQGVASVDAMTAQHLLFQFDGRFAHDLMFIYCLADQTRRHAVTRSVSARCKTGHGAADEFISMVADSSFGEKVAEAIRNPRSDAGFEALATPRPLQARVAPSPPTAPSCLSS